MTLVVGAYALDTDAGRVGVVLDADAVRVRLKPVGGGQVWEAEPTAVRVATVEERIRARTAYVNARSRGEVL